MTFLDIGKQRLAAQHVSQSDFTSAAEVVQYMGAMQAQDYPGALWSIALRTASLTQRAVEAAIAERTIIRTWPMRGTLHFVATEDARWMTQLLAPRILQRVKKREQDLDLNEAVFEKARGIITEALTSELQLERSKLLSILETAGIATGNQRGYHILWRFAQEGLICFGSHVGKQPSFALLDRWAPHSNTFERPEALRKLAVRYFTSHGPATLKDFAGWGSMTITDAKRGIELAEDNITKTLYAGESYWHSPELRPIAPHSAFLLPGFDEYILGYKDRSAVATVEELQNIVPGGNGVFRPTIVVDGKVIGAWRRVTRTKETVLTLEPFNIVPPEAMDALQSVISRYANFLGTEVKVH